MPVVRADHGQCQGYGNCVLAAADTFDHDDDGLVTLLRSEIPDADRVRIELAALSCPVQALTVADE
jgi:3-phenylpropionate/trans-cinnamate dioxygenase ferredoxin reductase subunit